MTDIATEFLDHYLADETKSRFAVMIEGPWGAGKTWFVKRYLTIRAAARRKADPLNGDGYVYVSLYGKSSRAEIAAALFTAAHPILAGKWIQGGIGVLGRLANTATRGQAVKATDAAALQTAVTELRGKVIVFDDVERCEMPQAELFGYLNDFVEGQHLKVLLIANEAELSAKHKVDYKAQKEKVVGKTLEVKADASAAYRALAGQLGNPVARKAAQDNEAGALIVFHASGTNNIRSIRAALDDFARVVSAADLRLAESEAGLQTLLLYMLATTFESRAGRLESDEFPKIASSRLMSYFGRGSKREPSDEEARLTLIADTYENVDWSDPIVPPEVIAQLYKTGALDVARLNAALSSHQLIVPPAEAPAWRLLWHWFKAGKSGYDYARARALKDLEAEAVHHPGPILHLAGTALSLTKHGDPLVADVVQYFCDYIDRQVASGTLVADMDFGESSHETGFSGLGFAEDDDPGFKAVFAHLRSAISVAFDNNMKAEAPFLLERLRLRPSTEVGLSIHSDEPSVYRRRPILHHIDPADFIDVCLNDCRLDEDVIGLLAGRYHNGARRLQIEGPWIATVRAGLEAKAQAAPAPFKTRLKGAIDYWFDGIEKSILEGARA